MSLLHKLVLLASLGFLGLSLVIPGLIEIFKLQPGSPGLLPETVNTKNQLRALNGMMAGFGFIALWACVDLENSRTLVLSLGSMLFLVVIARIYSFFVDGMPDLMTWVYVIIEIFLALVFIIWPPGE